MLVLIFISFLHLTLQSGLDPEQYPLKVRNTVTRMREDLVNLELIASLLAAIEEQYADVSGAVLVFLPGLSAIHELNEMLLAERRYADPARLYFHPFRPSDLDLLT